MEPVGDWAVDLSGYQPKEEGKGLSSNDYTSEEKAKLAGLTVATTPRWPKCWPGCSARSRREEKGRARPASRVRR